MARRRAARWLILCMTVVLLSPGCSDSADDADTGTTGISATVTEPSSRCHHDNDQECVVHNDDDNDGS